MADETATPPRTGGWLAVGIRSPIDAGGGLFLIAVAAIALWQSADLAQGSLRQPGAGMVPRWVAIAIAFCGLVLVVRSFLADGAALERWSIRGPFFILGAAVAFGLAVRPLGLAVAGPLAVCIGALASRESRVIEMVVFAVVMTAFCVALFRFALGLPIPLAPWALGY